MADRKVLICTLGPSSLNERVIPQLEAAGVVSFRINMSHTEMADLESVIHFIQNCTRVPICIDTEGAQIRTGLMQDGVAVVEGRPVRLVPQAIRATSTFALTPGDAIGQLRPGARMSIDFDSVILRIDAVDGGAAEATVLTGGEIGSRKAVTAFPSPPSPPSRKRTSLRFNSPGGTRSTSTTCPSVTIPTRCGSCENWPGPGPGSSPRSRAGKGCGIWRRSPGPPTGS